MNKKRGFTLIELLVVVLIIGILSAIALPQYQRAVKRARFAEVETNVRAMYQAMQRYYLANDAYPNTNIEFNSVDGVDIEVPACKCVPGTGCISCKYKFDRNSYGGPAVYYEDSYENDKVNYSFFIPMQSGNFAGGTVTKGELYTLRADHDDFGFTQQATTLAGSKAYIRP